MSLFHKIQNEEALSDQEKVDKVWRQFSNFLETFFARSARSCTVPMNGTKKPHRLKGAPVRFREKNWLVHRAYDQATPNILRVKRRLLGRLLEEQQRRNHGQTLPYNDPLWVKIRRCPHWHPALTVADLAKDIQELENHDKRQKLSRWRDKVRSSAAETFKWLRAMYTHSVFDDGTEGPEGCATHAQELCKN